MTYVASEVFKLQVTTSYYLEILYTIVASETFPNMFLAGPEGLGRKNFKIWTQETDGLNYCYGVYTFPMGYKSLVA
jgi:hypothetical protein